MAEQTSFVFVVTFIIVFTGLLATMPTGLLGYGESGNALLPIDPDLLVGFSAVENWTRTDYISIGGGYYQYDYDLGGYGWVALTEGTSFTVAQKVKFFGVWLGGTKIINFILGNGTSRGAYLTLDEIAGDATDGQIKYDLEYADSGNDAGGFIVYWNTTTYATPALAWAGDGLYLVHGWGLTSPSYNVVSLILGLLFFELPEVPFLVNLVLATPLWVSVAFLVWWLITQSLPFWA